MIRKPAALLAAAILLCASTNASAQIIQYIGCDVIQSGQFESTIDSAYGALSGGYRPTMTLIQTTFNGSNPNTHTILFEHANYAGVQNWAQRVASTPAAQLILQRTGANRECNTQGIAVQRAAWGDQDADWGYVAVFPVTTSDAGTYAALLDELFTSETGQAFPGATMLYEARAGAANTHFIVAQAPDFVALNDFLDTLFQSDDYADFAEEASQIRSLGLRTQSRHVRTWEP